MSEDKRFKNLVNVINMDAEPDKDYKEKLFLDLMNSNEIEEEKTTRLQEMFFIKPWRYVLPLSFLISAVIKIVMGSSFNTLVFNMLIRGGF